MIQEIPFEYLLCTRPRVSTLCITVSIRKRIIFREEIRKKTKNGQQAFTILGVKFHDGEMSGHGNTKEQKLPRGVGVGAEIRSTVVVG